MHNTGLARRELDEHESWVACQRSTGGGDGGRPTLVQGEREPQTVVQARGASLRCGGGRTHMCIVPTRVRLLYERRRPSKGGHENRQGVVWLPGAGRVGTRTQGPLANSARPPATTARFSWHCDVRVPPGLRVFPRARQTRSSLLVRGVEWSFTLTPCRSGDVWIRRREAGDMSGFVGAHHVTAATGGPHTAEGGAMKAVVCTGAVTR